MELITCANCRSVYGDVQGQCPHCDADPEGEGAAVEFDGATRTAIASLGGVFGGILPGPDETYLLWCARGVCLFSELTGLVWHSPLYGRVEEAGFAAGAVRARVRGRAVELRLEDGLEIED